MAYVPWTASSARTAGAARCGRIERDPKPQPLRSCQAQRVRRTMGGPMATSPVSMLESEFSGLLPVRMTGDGPTP